MRFSVRRLLILTALVAATFGLLHSMAKSADNPKPRPEPPAWLVNVTAVVFFSALAGGVCYGYWRAAGWIESELFDRRQERHDEEVYYD